MGTSISYERFAPFFPPYFPPFFPPSFNPCAGSPAAGTCLQLHCDGQYLYCDLSDGCHGTTRGGNVLVNGWCGYVDCATHACPTASPAWNIFLPYDGGNGWTNGSYNTQSCSPHCSNAGYGITYCNNPAHNSYWIAYNDGTACCAFNLFIYCA